jgi:hypothetical protein
MRAVMPSSVRVRHVYIHALIVTCRQKSKTTETVSKVRQQRMCVCVCCLLTSPHSHAAVISACHSTQHRQRGSDTAQTGSVAIEGSST